MSSTRAIQEDEESGPEDEESGPEYEDRYAPRQKEIRKGVFEDEEGNPICFFIHMSVKKKSAVDKLTRDIEENGGVVKPDDYGVDTVLVDERYVNREHLQVSYEISFDGLRSETWVEPTAFVQRCLRERSVRHRPRPRKGMGGSLRPSRVPFTQEDDENLARYVAHRIPEREAGGRRGNGVWRELEQALSTNPNTALWAKRHPWQSWRNRYNKNVERFERMIDYYVRTDKPTGKQRYHLDRRLVRRRLVQSGQREEDEHERHVSPPAAKRRRVNDSLVTVVEDVGEYDRPSSKGKGKERASDSAHETDGQLSDHRSLFGDSEPDEPGPSVKQRAQVTYAKRGRRMPPSSPPPFSREPQTSQATLVASAAQLRDHRAHIPREDMPHLLPQQPEPTIANPIREAVRIEPRLVKDDAADNAAYFPAATSAASPNSHNQSRRRGITTRAGTALAISSQKRQAAAIKRAPRPRPEPAAPIASSPHAPFRNTRSRSRSVEPAALPSRSKPRHEKKTVAEVEEMKVLPVLASLAEVPDEDDVQTLESQDVSKTSAPAGETLEEEMNVENFLVNNISGRSQVTEESARDTNEAVAFPETASSPAVATDNEMDSDDAKTDSMLHHPPPEHVSQRPTSIFNIEPDGIRPDEMLRMFDKSLPAPSTTRSSRLSSVRPPAFFRPRNDTSTRLRYSVASGSNRDSYEAARAPSSQPRTPANRRARARMNSLSSVESFPIAGTKASAVKKRIEEKEKHTPYRPPRGTRAALFSQ